MSGGDVETFENAQPIVEELPQELKDIKAILYQARAQNALTKGIRQCLKVIEAKKALYCFIAEDCDNDKYTGLLKAICKEQGVKIVMVPQKIQLGEWTNQCKIRDGAAVRIAKCSCATVGCNIKFTDEVKRLNAKTN
ncbi:40S ribosomal protein S12, putative [Entamoeba dispar SAW760]|uniref:40S ribosomal protein S12, putative n=1 Tax=Entamoeba dispar (strain ATCC PRA-260 / SAW760) TaxID=370354 RepID=B0EDE2_ENTDS|nr:40S ribosomal protein S12, putative [Entamoeba dispar SAW760]EDR27559.1 40S ribosomal protein S12, putative [Entamoeba dispar SAW760]|eukprot:EDR27559.1 40S ribosomal protein S12, putative [Entamoeba dispar SAW760]